MSRLTSEDVQVSADILAKMFVSALVQNTNPVENEKHKIAPCPILYWEDFYGLDDCNLTPHGYNNNKVN